MFSCAFKLIGVNGGTQPYGLSLTEWYEMVAFDVLGEMAFDESFCCIERGKLNLFLFAGDCESEEVYC